MRALPRLAFLAFLTGTLSACSTYSIEELRHTAPRGTPFQASLAMEYLRFSEDQARNVDWADAGYFAEKGLQAAYGNDVAPESLDNWYIPASERPALEQARGSLLAALTPEHIEAHPDVAARAQMDFDCWVKAVDGKWNQERLLDCKDGLDEALKELISEPPAKASVAAPASAPEATAIAEPAQDAAETPPVASAPALGGDTAAYIVLFATASAALDEQNRHLVDVIVEDLKKNDHDGNYSIVLNGHTDTVGSARYNFELSKHRADTVKKALVARGIPEKNIHAFGFGESDLAVKTGNNVAERRNRRVEIFLGD